MSGLRESARWKVLGANPAVEHAIVSACGVSTLAAHVMAARGIRDARSAQRFLNPSLETDWLDPLELPGLAAAADRVERAVRSGEVIAVFGDFDVDGMSATCLLSLALRELGARVHPYIPRRFGEGYGLSSEALERVVEGCHPDLIVTVDNGIAAAEEVRLVRSMGIDVVVTDHHEPADLVPEGIAVCDPKLDHDCPSCDLAGAGVALKLVQELGRRLGAPDLWHSLTEVATLGTVSDMMTLTAENRALVADGIRRMRVSERAGIVALAAASGVELADIEADSLPFSLIPRLNAAGRMGDVDVAFDLLMESDPVRATELAARLETINQNRRDIERELADQAMAMVEETYHPGDRAIVVGGEGWHEGVKGIVASRVVNRYHVPAILFSISDGVAHGSGRSVGSVNLFSAVERCADLLVRFGGHAGAVGVTVDAENIDEFRTRLQAVLAELPAEQFLDTGEVAAVVGLGELDVPTIRSLGVLRPFGQGNKVPLLAATGVTMRLRGRVGRAGEHLRFVATDGVSSVPAIMFRTPDVEGAVDYDGAVDLVFEAVAETWQGRTKPKLMVKETIYRTADGRRATPVVDELFSRVPQVLAGAPAPDEAPTPDAAQRSKLAALPPDELAGELRRRMIGDRPLLAAQFAALDVLAHGRSCLCVMATGRGKSLVFHLHAAREAIARGRASVFVSPLRALVADQSFHIATELAGMGVAARVLPGETPAARRAEALDGLARGQVDVVLTTPEFLAIHSADLARSGRVGFLVVDEAHHVGASEAARDAYQQLPRIIDELGDPCCLALTATAQPAVARRICKLARIEPNDVIVDAASRANLALDDERGAREREDVLVSLASTGEKCVVYVNSREQSVVLARALRKRTPEMGQRIAFYNAGLTRSERTRVERAFRAGELTCVISTSAFGEGVNLPDIRHVVLYHLPFGAVEFNQMSGRAGRDGLAACVHVLFGSGDARVNERILASYAPDRDDLVCLYRTLRTLAGRAGQAGVRRTNAEIAEACLGIRPGRALEERAVSAGIAIFRELGFLETSGYGSGRTIRMRQAPERMELSRSIRYLEGMRSAREFELFRDWALCASAEELRARVISPIVPGFGRLVNEGEGKAHE